MAMMLMLYRLSTLIYLRPSTALTSKGYCFLLRVGDQVLAFAAMSYAEGNKVAWIKALHVLLGWKFARAGSCALRPVDLVVPRCKNLELIPI